MLRSGLRVTVAVFSSRSGARQLPALAGDRTALLVTWIDERCFGPGGEYRDPHSGPLATMLQERGLRVAPPGQAAATRLFPGLCDARCSPAGRKAAFADLLSLNGRLARL